MLGPLCDVLLSHHLHVLPTCGKWCFLAQWRHLRRILPPWLLRRFDDLHVQAMCLHLLGMHRPQRRTVHVVSCAAPPADGASTSSMWLCSRVCTVASAVLGA
jgi:hypothetical protein